jgi:hypothetical protein
MECPYLGESEKERHSLYFEMARSQTIHLWQRDDEEIEGYIQYF